jgi:hypothetical protein
VSHWNAPIGATDEWYTPKYIFDALGVEFDLDVASPPDGPPHVPCKRYIWQHSLDKPWDGFVWMNPPFGGRNGIVPWLDKFFDHGNGIALMPDRTSAPWFQSAMRRADAMLFMSPKVRFETPSGLAGAQPSNGIVLASKGYRGYAALHDAHGILGCLTIPHKERI